MSTELEKAASRCFGVMDRIFRSHHNDEREADALKRNPSYSMSEKIQACEDYLVRNKCTQQHIDTEMKKVRKFFK